MSRIFRTWGKVAWTEMKLYFREPIGMFFTLGFPMMMLLLFGSIYGNKPVEMFGGYGTVDVSVPAYAAMIIGTTGLMGVAPLMATYREYGILRRYGATPLRPEVFLAGEVSVLFAMTMAGLGLLIATAKVVYGLRFQGNALSFAGALVLSCLTLDSLGFLLAGLMPSARTASAVTMAVFYPMLFMSGAGLPRELLPAGMRRVAEVFPLTHVVTLLRGLWFGDAWGKLGKEVAILAAFLVAGVGISSRLFRWD